MRRIYTLILLVASFGEACTTHPDIHTEKQAGKTATLIVGREKKSWVGAMAHINIFIDEKPVGNVGNGEEASFNFYPKKKGPTSFRFETSDIDWAGFLEKASQDTTLESRFRKRFSFKVRPEDTVSFYISYETKAILVNRTDE